MTLELQFPKSEIKQWAERYLKALKPKEKELEDEIEQELAARVKREGYLHQNDFQRICKWKTGGRTEHWYKENEPAFVKVVTQTAFSSSNEKFRIVALGMLKGVDWPTASALLHFGHPDPYPVLDAYALHAVGIQEPQKYNFEMWQSYTGYCRKLAAECKVDMRTLDRALWQYGKENPPKRKKKKEPGKRFSLQSLLGRS